MPKYEFPQNRFDLHVLRGKAMRAGDEIFLESRSMGEFRKVDRIATVGVVIACGSFIGGTGLEVFIPGAMTAGAVIACLLAGVVIVLWIRWWVILRRRRTSFCRRAGEVKKNGVFQKDLECLSVIALSEVVGIDAEMIAMDTKVADIAALCAIPPLLAEVVVKIASNHEQVVKQEITSSDISNIASRLEKYPSIDVATFDGVVNQYLMNPIETG